MTRPPLLVELSARLYRLLLTAYPTAFRREYGEPMTQLFRDSALDAYRVRGLLGLVGVSLRGIVDLARTAPRQHWEAIMTASDPLSVPYLLQRWVLFIGLALSVAALSARFAFHLACHLVSRPTFLLCVSVGVWAGSYHKEMDLHYGKSRWEELRIAEGAVEIRFLSSTPEGRLWKDRESWWYREPPRTAGQFSFSSGYVAGVTTIEEVVPAYYCWLLRFPFWVVPALLLGWVFYRLSTRRRCNGETSCGDDRGPELVSAR